MSRIRTTLDSVTKAVGGTDILSKISRFKNAASAAGGGAHGAEKVATVEAEPLVAAGETAPAAADENDMKPPERDEEKKVGEVIVEAETQQQQQQQHQRVPEKPFVVVATTKQAKPSLASAAAAAASVAASSSSSSSVVAKQTLQLFHPSALSANMDETYNTLAQHVNSYFRGTGTQTQGGAGSNSDGPRQPPGEGEAPVLKPVFGPSAGDHEPTLAPVAEAKCIDAGATPTAPPTAPEVPGPPTGTPPSSPDSPPADVAVPSATTSLKKGFTHYLSYPRPSVREFVGSYIAPLVPKFRGQESKSIAAAEKDKLLPSAAVVEAVMAKAGETAETDDEKEEEKTKKLLLTQREKIIARVSLDNRTRALVKGLQRVNDVKLLTSRIEELNCHLMEFPETRGVAIKESVIPCLLRLRQARDEPLQAAVREALALVGYTDPVKGRGIRVLAIDGGGTRGLMALQTLHKLQKLTGKPIYQLFDYICGVSTGAILAFMLGVFQIPLDECEEMYRKLGSDVFKQNVIVGTVKMGWSHAFYNSEVWENLLKERLGEGLMVESARDPNCPKVSAVSTVVNRGLPLKAYVFRNYRMLPGTRSHYLGDCKHKMWQAIRASSAAPGYFQEFVLGKDLHQDGGLLVNNPTALAIHECKCLWPNTPVQCVVSLGTGRYETEGKNNTNYTSLKAKLTNVISSATDTEEVHIMLDALLPPDTYFRFNPYMSEDIPLDESRLEKLNFLKSEGDRYLARNEAKLQKAASVLSQEKSAIQRLAEWAKLKADMYEGLPFTSKL